MACDNFQDTGSYGTKKKEKRKRKRTKYEQKSRLNISFP